MTDSLVRPLSLMLHAEDMRLHLEADLRVLKLVQLKVKPRSLTHRAVRLRIESLDAFLKTLNKDAAA